MRQAAVQGVSVDVVGNSYVTGSFSNYAVFNTTQLNSYGQKDIFIAKYDKAGNLLWVKQVGGIEDDIARGIVTDAAGNSYVTGNFSKSIKFGTDSLDASNGSIFITKIDSSGNFLWVKQAGGSEVGANCGFSITLSEIGYCFVTGQFRGVAKFDNFQLTDKGYTDIFVAKYDVSGNCQWVTQVGGFMSDCGLSIAVDEQGQSYVGGYFHTGSINQIADIFLGKFDVNGNLVWKKNIGNQNWSIAAKGVSVDLNGDVVITGNFFTSYSNPIPTSFDQFPLIGKGGNDIFVAKYDKDGNCLWAKNFGGVNADYGDNILADDERNYFLTGTGNISSSIGGFFVAKFTTTGDTIWIKRGATQGSGSSKIALDKNSDLRMIGEFNADTYFDAIKVIKNINDQNNPSYLAKIIFPKLKIASPIGNEKWQTLSVRNISWVSSNIIKLKIELTTDGGTNWILLANNVHAELGSINFTVPPFTTTNDCQIRITDLTYNLMSISPNKFTITPIETPSLTINQPNTKTTWSIGSLQNILWKVHGNISNVKLEYTSDSGNKWNVITNSIPAAQENFNWTIPTIIPSKECRIKICAVADESNYDLSDSLFSIQYPSGDYIFVSSINFGEVWKAGTEKNITWQYSNSNPVNLFFSSDSGQSWNSIAENIPSIFKNFVWVVPKIFSTRCLIKIQDAINANLVDISDYSFTIWTPTISEYYPILGQIEKEFDSTHITLSAFVVIQDTISVIFNYLEAPQDGSLPLGILRASKYFWSIKANSISFINGGISIPVTVLEDFIDKTKLVWLKRLNPGDDWTNHGGTLLNGFLINTIPFNSFSEFAIGATDVVPVELTSFIGYITQKNNATLEWKTSTEKNNNGFEIEKLYKDYKLGNSKWTQIGFVAGNGTTTEPHNYSYLDNSTVRGKCVYRLKQIDYDGKYEYSKEVEVDLGMPTKFLLEQNFPNPFNPTTTLSYALPYESNVKLVVYNLIGEVVKELVNETVTVGYQEVSFDAGQLSSGIYFYTLNAVSLDGKQNYQSVKKMLLLK